MLSINSYFFQSIPTFSIMQIEASLVTQTVKNLSAMQETQKFSHWVRKILWRRKWLPTPIFLPGEFHGQRNLVGCSPWGRTRLRDFSFTFHFHALEKEMATHSSVLAWRIQGTGEPRGLPSMGVSQSQTRLKRLSSSSSSKLLHSSEYLFSFCFFR